MGDGMTMQLLVTLGYSLPELLACGIGLAMLWSAAPAGQGRKLGLWGLGLMLACALLQLGLGLLQTVMISRAMGDSAASLNQMFSLLGGVRMVLNLAWLAGLLLLVRGLCVALRAQRG